ncbi:MAG: pilus assembly protein [Planctomycetales bacterium]|nr:pilus assembly protein [Planctomycetales bacterium]
MRMRTRGTGYRRLTSRPRTLSGVATLEMAVCLPMLVIITFCSIEAANFIYLKQSLTEAAYEAVRVATATGQNAGQGHRRFQEIIDAREIQGAHLTLSPNVNSRTLPGTLVTATVTAPIRQNSYSPEFHFHNGDITVSVVMARL